MRQAEAFVGSAFLGRPSLLPDRSLQALSQYQTQQRSFGLEKLHGKLQWLRDDGGRGAMVGEGEMVGDGSL